MSAGESSSNIIPVGTPPYREGTHLPKLKFNIAFNGGGLGDYIHWVGAVRYVIDTNPHIWGRIMAPKYFYDLAELWLGKYDSRFEVVEFDRLDKDPAVEDCISIVPNHAQLVNACGFHITTLGFYYYTQKAYVPPEYATLPIINGDEVDISRFSLPKDYAVIPTEATAEVRMFRADLINSITKHLLDRGVTPVFLGKKNLAPGYEAKHDDGIKTRGVTDLRELTTLREAACIMAHSRFVLGMDGGLLHLASCSLAPVVFTFTTVHPNFRIPHRRTGTDTIVVTPPKDLECRFCNTGEPNKPAMNYLAHHDFKNCLYRDNLCTKILDSRTYIPIIDKLLEKGRNGN